MTESDIPPRVNKALALVDRALESEEGLRSVGQQTGGNAPELVQGILDRIAQLYARLRAPVDPPERVSEASALREACQRLVDAHGVVTINGGAGWARHVQPVIYDIMKILRALEDTKGDG